MKIHIIKYLFTIYVVLSSAFGIKAESEYQPLCVENRIWIYSEFYNGRAQQLQHKVLKIRNTTEINGKTYHNCYAYDYDNPASSLCLVAYLREEDGKVYMLENNDSYIRYTLRQTYGSESIETLIYDFSIKESEIFQVGEDKYYDNSSGDDGYIYYSDLLWMATDNGRILCISTENASQSNYYSSSKQLELVFIAPEKKSYKYGWFEQYMPTKTFRIQEGIGLLSNASFQIYTVMGYFPFPYYREMTLDWETKIDLLYVCDDGDFSNVIYRQEGLPVTPERYFATLAVDEVSADEYTEPEYYNIQGMPVSNPTEGEIYIVKRGSKATKEVYRR